MKNKIIIFIILILVIIIIFSISSKNKVSDNTTEETQITYEEDNTSEHYKYIIFDENHNEKGRVIDDSSLQLYLDNPDFEQEDTFLEEK